MWWLWGRFFSCGERQESQRGGSARIIDADRFRPIKNRLEFAEHGAGPPTAGQWQIGERLTVNATADYCLEIGAGSNQVGRYLISGRPVGEDRSQQVAEQNDMRRVGLAGLRLWVLVGRECLRAADGFQNCPDLAAWHPAVCSQFL